MSVEQERGFVLVRRDVLDNAHRLAAPIDICGVACPTAAHAFNVCKYMYAGAPPQNRAWAQMIAGATTIKWCNALSRRFAPPESPHYQVLKDHLSEHPHVVVDPRFSEFRVETMRFVLYEKFWVDEQARACLMETGDVPIFVYTGEETFWGVNAYGEGENILGQLLESIREDLRWAPKEE